MHAATSFKSNHTLKNFKGQIFICKQAKEGLTTPPNDSRYTKSDNFRIIQ